MNIKTLMRMSSYFLSTLPTINSVVFISVLVIKITRYF